MKQINITRKKIRPILMYQKTANCNNQKLSKVIQLSLNYQNHRKLVDNIRPSINIPSMRSVKKLDMLTMNKIRYADESRVTKRKLINLENEQNQKRINKTSSVYKKLYQNPQQGFNKTLKKSASRLNSQSSLHSSSSQRSVLSNFRQRTMRYKQIERENKKMATRISNPKTNKQNKIKELDKSYEKEQQYLRIRSRFSERSKSIMKSLMLDGLKFQRKNLQFLPQITNKHNKNCNTVQV